MGKHFPHNCKSIFERKEGLPMLTPWLEPRRYRYLGKPTLRRMCHRQHRHRQTPPPKQPRRLKKNVTKTPLSAGFLPSSLGGLELDDFTMATSRSVSSGCSGASVLMCAQASALLASPLFL